MTKNENPQFLQFLSILENARQAVFSRPGQYDPRIYSRMLDVEVKFGTTPIKVELIDKDLEAVIITTKNGKRMFKKRVIQVQDEMRIDYPATTIYERHVIEDWPDFQTRFEELTAKHGPLVVSASLDEIGKASIS